MSWGALRHPDADFPDSRGTDLGRHLVCPGGQSDLSPFATDTYAKVGDWPMNRPRCCCMLRWSNCRHCWSAWSLPLDGLTHEMVIPIASTEPMAFQFFEGVNVRKALTLRLLFFALYQPCPWSFHRLPKLHPWPNGLTPAGRLRSARRGRRFGASTGPLGCSTRVP